MIMFYHVTIHNPLDNRKLLYEVLDMLLIL